MCEHIEDEGAGEVAEERRRRAGCVGLEEAGVAGEGKRTSSGGK